MVYTLLVAYMKAWMIFDALYFIHVEMYTPICALVLSAYSYGVDPLPLMLKGERVLRDLYE